MVNSYLAACAWTGSKAHLQLASRTTAGLHPGICPSCQAHTKLPTCSYVDTGHLSSMCSRIVCTYSLGSRWSWLEGGAAAGTHSGPGGGVHQRISPGMGLLGSRWEGVRPFVSVPTSGSAVLVARRAGRGQPLMGHKAAPSPSPPSQQ